VKPTPLIGAAALLLYGLWRLRRGRLTLPWGIAGAIAIGALVAYGTGLVHPPSLEHILRSTGSALGAWTYLLVGGLAFLETGAFIGLVAPGETAVLLGGFVAGQGKINVFVLIAIVWTAAVCGDLLSYSLGRRLGREFLLEHGPKVKITHDRLERVEEFFARHGGPAILLGRFVGLVRAILPFVAGTSRLPLRRFIPFDVVGAGLWGGSLVLLGYFFWQSFTTVTDVAHQGFLALGTVIVLVVGGVWIRRQLHDDEQRAKIVAYMEARPYLRPFLRAAQAVDRHLSSPRALETVVAVGVALAGAVGYGVMAAAVGTGPTGLDGHAFDVFSHIRPKAGVHVAKAITVLGSSPVVGGVLIATVLWLLTRRRVVTATTLVAAGVADVIALHVAKGATGRPRPPHPLGDTQGSSFPSGHAAYSIAYLAVSFVLWRSVPGFRARIGLIVISLVLAVLIGLSRVYLRAHFLTDVLAGWALGLAVFGIAALVALTVERVRHNEARR
jgi:membrane protein DedA with SNARE-associated domain/membrane-associated phospholipid phosphatase